MRVSLIINAIVKFMKYGLSELSEIDMLVENFFTNRDLPLFAIIAFSSFESPSRSTSFLVSLFYIDMYRSNRYLHLSCKSFLLSS